MIEVNNCCENDEIFINYFIINDVLFYKFIK